MISLHRGIDLLATGSRRRIDWHSDIKILNSGTSTSTYLSEYSSSQRLLGSLTVDMINSDGNGKVAFASVRVFGNISIGNRCRTNCISDIGSCSQAKDGIVLCKGRLQY